jgi:5S rRNA maturation endonuclease (ribonuclease M5)
MTDLTTQAKGVNLKELIEKETGHTFKSGFLESCPFCNSGAGTQGTPAFSIKESKQIFKCFSCDKAGNVIEFIRYFKNLEAADSIKYIVSTYVNDSKLDAYQKPKEQKTNWEKALYAIKNNPIGKAAEYLQSRSIDVSSLPKRSFYYDSLENAVVFFDSQNKLINKRLIAPISGTKAKFATGSQINNSLYDELYLSDKSEVYICEGVINAMSLKGLSSLAVFTTGNKFTQADKLEPYLKGKTVVLAFDNDKAGNHYTESFSAFLKQSGIEFNEVKQLFLPDSQDINDLLKMGVLDEHLQSQGNYKLLFESEVYSVLKPIEVVEGMDKTEFQSVHNFKIMNGCYYLHEHKRDQKISNFIMQFVYHFLDGSKDTKRLIKIQHESGRVFLVEVQSSELKPDSLETILRSHDCTFLGAPYTLKSIIMYLMSGQKNAVVLDKLGFNTQFDIYTLSESVIDSAGTLTKANKLGILTNKEKTFYLPSHAMSNIDNEEFESIRRFRYKHGNLDFAQWSKLLYEAYDLNGSIGLCYLINSLFRDIIFKELNFFPFLFLYGPPGVGKSSYIEFILKLFGDKDPGISIKNSSVKGMARSISQKTNALVFLKEYDNEISIDLISLLKNAYDGVSYTVAQKSNDNKTNTYLVESGLLIDGNVYPTAESAMFDRMIVLFFESNKFSEVSTNAHKTLTDESDIGLGQVLHEILKQREFFKARYKGVYRSILDGFKFGSEIHDGVNISSLPERNLKHIAFILTPVILLSQKLSFPFEYEQIKSKVLSMAVIKDEVLNDTNSISIFWDAINYERKSNSHRVLVNQHFQKDEYKNVLYIVLKELFPVYVEYARKNNLHSVDFTTLISLFTSQTYPFIPNTQKGRQFYYKKNFGNCYRFNYDKGEDSDSIIINGKIIYL